MRNTDESFHDIIKNVQSDFRYITEESLSVKNDFEEYVKKIDNMGGFKDGLDVTTYKIQDDDNIIEDKIFINNYFKDVDFTGVTFHKCVFVNVTFHNCILNSNILDSYISLIVFNNCIVDDLNVVPRVDFNSSAEKGEEVRKKLFTEIVTPNNRTAVLALREIPDTKIRFTYFKE